MLPRKKAFLLPRAGPKWGQKARAVTHFLPTFFLAAQAERRRITY